MPFSMIAQLLYRRILSRPSIRNFIRKSASGFLSAIYFSRRPRSKGWAMLAHCCVVNWPTYLTNENKNTPRKGVRAFALVRVQSNLWHQKDLGQVFEVC